MHQPILLGDLREMNKTNLLHSEHQVIIKVIPFRNQINYILINKIFRNVVAVYHVGDISSDHKPLIANVRLRLAKIKRTDNKKYIDTKKLIRDKYPKTTYTRHINENFRNIEQENGIEESCEKIKMAISKANETTSNKIKRN